jgi:hypothetical protein
MPLSTVSSSGASTTGAMAPWTRRAWAKNWDEGAMVAVAMAVVGRAAGEARRWQAVAGRS